MFPLFLEKVQHLFLNKIVYPSRDLSCSQDLLFYILAILSFLEFLGSNIILGLPCLCALLLQHPLPPVLCAGSGLLNSPDVRLKVFASGVPFLTPQCRLAPIPWGPLHRPYYTNCHCLLSPLALLSPWQDPGG